MTAVADRAAELGWTRVSDNRCPLSLRRRGRRHAGVDCWCTHRLNDHAATWRDTSGRKFVLWQPYWASVDAITELLPHTRDAGLRMWICPPVYSNGVIGIRFEVDERPECAVCGERGHDPGRGARLVHDDPAVDSRCLDAAYTWGFTL